MPLDVLAGAAAAVAVLALVVAARVAVRLRALERGGPRAGRVGRGGGRGSGGDRAGDRTLLAEIDRLRAELDGARADLDRARTDLTGALRHVAVVRYDAFGDLGGRLSWSAALLDDAGDGIVLTTIAGRTETRSYAKGVARGAAEQPLSPEEQRAVAAARRGVRPH